MRSTSTATTSTATTSSDRRASHTHRGKHARASTLLWTAQILLAAVFIFAAAPKVAGQHTAVAMFGQIGAGPAPGPARHPEPLRPPVVQA
jgi:hypothetical protein